MTASARALDAELCSRQNEEYASRRKSRSFRRLTNAHDRWRVAPSTFQDLDHAPDRPSVVRTAEQYKRPCLFTTFPVATMIP